MCETYTDRMSSALKLEIPVRSRTNDGADLRRWPDSPNSPMSEPNSFFADSTLTNRAKLRPTTFDDVSMLLEKLGENRIVKFF